MLSFCCHRAALLCMQSVRGFRESARSRVLHRRRRRSWLQENVLDVNKRAIREWEPNTKQARRRRRRDGSSGAHPSSQHQRAFHLIHFSSFIFFTRTSIANATVCLHSTCTIPAEGRKRSSPQSSAVLHIKRYMRALLYTHNKRLFWCGILVLLVMCVLVKEWFCSPSRLCSMLTSDAFMRLILPPIVLLLCFSFVLYYTCCERFLLFSFF